MKMDLEGTLDKLLDIYPRLKIMDTKERYKVAIATLLDELSTGVDRGLYKKETLSFYVGYIREIFKEEKKRDWN